jgi:hypothetical protein
LSERESEDAGRVTRRAGVCVDEEEAGDKVAGLLLGTKVTDSDVVLDVAGALRPVPRGCGVVDAVVAMTPLI